MADLNFTFEEYKLLHAEIDAHVQETLRLETYVVGALAAMYTWLFAKGTIRFPFSQVVPAKLIERIATFLAKQAGERAKGGATSQRRK